MEAEEVEGHWQEVTLFQGVPAMQDLMGLVVVVFWRLAGMDLLQTQSSRPRGGAHF
jgi:hypothetical protein